MNLKTLSLAEQFPWLRRKVLSGFGLGVGISLIVFAVLYLGQFQKGSSVEPMFQGFESISMNSSFSDSPSANGNSSSAISENKGNLEGSDGKGPVLKTTQLSNFTQQGKNGSFNGDEGRFQQQTNAPNGAVVGEKSTPSDSKNEVLVLDQKDYPGNSSKIVENGSLSGKEDLAIEKTAPEVSLKNYSDGENEDRGNNTKGNVIVNVTSQVEKIKSASLQDCNIFDGKWVRDDSKPYYPPGSCPHIDRDFDCHLNGRPDNGYVKWKWQPNGCEIPSLNATDFLERLRGKSLVFVGDSLNRNMWESMVCILRQSIKNKKKVYEISGKREFKKKGFYAFRFEDYNCSVDFVSSPFLVRESSFTGKNGTFETLRLDLMDQTTKMYYDADILIFNTGHWWTHEKTSKGEDYYQEGNYVHPRLKVLEAYTRALKTWARWVDKNVDNKRTQVFFRGYSVTHFRGGPWNSGGQCHKETEPIFNSTYLAKYNKKMRALEYVIQDMKTPVTYLNISRLTDYRKDGHPSIYRMEYKSVEEQIAAVHSQDCSHWCLPGVPDTWNELLYVSLLKTNVGSWRY
ncbi:protein trichome birefringence-like 2 [Humulus lupulus]|uniref:protein trichome birefringence-like 2 n=1 Tax=Humulus lupulus TaxID=3486 RepID=UPI002B40EB78|nr:protein trichome birefringence-like 2 [Humulus lupulus]